MKAAIKDFTDTALWTIQETLNEHWAKNGVELQEADVELRLHPGARELTECPAVFWEYKDSSFVIIKIAESTYKA